MYLHIAFMNCRSFAFRYVAYAYSCYYLLLHPCPATPSEAELGTLQRRNSVPLGCAESCSLDILPHMGWKTQSNTFSNSFWLTGDYHKTTDAAGHFLLSQQRGSRWRKEGAARGWALPRRAWLGWGAATSVQVQCKYLGAVLLGYCWLQSKQGDLLC